MLVSLMPDYASLMQTVLADLADHSKWTDATFSRIKTLSNTKVGDAGQNFVEAICGELDLVIAFPEQLGVRKKQSPWDIDIEGVKFELKTATEDVNNCFQFNHIRYHRPYDALLCLGIGPNDIWFDVWSKADITTGKAGSLVSMEKGANASYKLTKRPHGLRPIGEFASKVRAFSTGFQN